MHIKNETQNIPITVTNPHQSNAWTVLALFFKTFAARPVVLVTLRVLLNAYKFAV